MRYIYIHIYQRNLFQIFISTKLIIFGVNVFQTSLTHNYSGLQQPSVTYRIVNIFLWEKQNMQFFFIARTQTMCAILKCAVVRRLRMIYYNACCVFHQTLSSGVMRSRADKRIGCGQSRYVRYIYFIHKNIRRSFRKSTKDDLNRNDGRGPLIIE